MKEYKGRAVVDLDGTFKVRLEGDLPDAPSRPALVAIHSRNREPGWTPIDGEPIVCIVDRDEIVHIVASGVIKQTIGLETPIGRSSPEPMPGRRLCVYLAEVISVGITDRWATIHQEGPAGRILEKVPVAQMASVVSDQNWFPQAGDRVLVLFEEYPIGGAEGHVIVGPALPVLDYPDSDTSLRAIAQGVKNLDMTVNKALDDWRRGSLGGKR